MIRQALLLLHPNVQDGNVGYLPPHAIARETCQLPVWVIRLLTCTCLERNMLSRIRERKEIEPWPSRDCYSFLYLLSRFSSPAPLPFLVLFQNPTDRKDAALVTFADVTTTTCTTLHCLVITSRLYLIPVPFRGPWKSMRGRG